MNWESTNNNLTRFAYSFADMSKVHKKSGQSLDNFDKGKSLRERILSHRAIVLLSLAFSALAAIAGAIRNIDQISRYLFGTPVEISNVTNNLASESIESRIKGANDAANLRNASPRILETALQILAATIKKRSNDPANKMPDDVQAALKSISELLKSADKRSLKVVFPEFEGLNYSFADMHGLYLRGITIRDSSLEDANLDEVNLTEAKLQNVALSRASFRSAILSSAEFYSSCLENTDFRKATLNSTTVESSDLNGANFENATLHGTKFMNTRLAYVTFKGAALRKADFGSALNLTKAQLETGKQLQNVTWPEEQNRISRLSICRG